MSDLKIVTVLWNGGWDDYEIDLSQIRELTPDEKASLVDGGNAKYFPEISGLWLRGHFLDTHPELGVGDNQAVKIIRHIGGGS